MSKKRIISLMVIGVLLSSVSVLATYLIESSDVEFDNTTANIPDANGDETVSVQEAIDYLINNMDSGGTEYTVVYDSDGGSSVDTYVSTVTPLPTPKKNGYNFVGWFKSDGTQVTSGTEVKEDTTLYAHWQAQSFANDDWDVIQANIRADNTSGYTVGDTRSVTLEGTGNLGNTYTVRLSNNSNYDCSSTSCGFVVEFAGIITTNRINPGSSNTGGWPATEMRSLLSSTVFDALPSDLQSVIADTTVVSGYGPNDSGCFTTTDKLYLLSTIEIYGVRYSDSSLLETCGGTKQLDYYKNKGVSVYTNSNGTKTIYNKNFAVKNSTVWWLRSPNYRAANTWSSVYTSGEPTPTYLYTAYGVSPAFRIGY